MPFVLGLITQGFLLLAFTVSWQVKKVTPDWLVTQYNLKTIPHLFIANVSLGINSSHMTGFFYKKFE